MDDQDDFIYLSIYLCAKDDDDEEEEEAIDWYVQSYTNGICLAYSALRSNTLLLLRSMHI